MKKGKDRLAKGILIVLLTLIAVLGFSKILTSDAAETNTKASNNVSKTIIVQGEKNPATYNYDIVTSTFGTLTYHGSTFLPSYGSYQIYCIEPGGLFVWSETIKYQELMAMVGDKYNSAHGCADTPREGDYTRPMFIATGGVRTLPEGVAYIISDTPIGAWSLEKQRGIWNLRDTYIDGYGRADGNINVSDAEPWQNNGGPSRFDKEAVDYIKYDLSVRDKDGLNPEDKTNIDSVYTKVNQDTSEYTVGPFNLTYTKGTYNNVTFGGISNMTVIGYNKYGEEIKDSNGKAKEIKIERIHLENNGKYGKSQTPEYFTPDKTTKVDRTKQVYPESGQNFQIVFKDPNKGLAENDPNRVAYISIKVTFRHMLANGKYQYFAGYQYYVAYNHRHYDKHQHSYKVRVGVDNEGNPIYKTKYYDCNACETTCYRRDVSTQDIISGDAIRTIYEQEIIIGKDGDIPVSTTMDLGGHVWEDVPATKESKTDGVSNTEGDKALPNVKVTLYVYNNGKEELANLLSNSEEANISEEELMHRVNPTYTDSNGNYMFKGLDPMKKYIVKFNYNGQTYLPTEYLVTANKQYSSVAEMVNAGLYNTDAWSVNSKGTEKPSERNAYDNQFAEIGSYPRNYGSSNSLGKVGAYNATFTQKDLMGYTLDRNGNYVQNEVQLIDGYLYDAKGLETTTYSQGVITTKVREFVNSHKKFPNDSEMKQIYTQIAGNNTELWQKLQFIEDCYIESYTGSPLKNGAVDVYPVYNQFRINHEENGSYSDITETLDGVAYKPIYPGQFYVNQGLWRRQEYDAALRKDLYRAALKINNKTAIYKYDKRTDDEEYWDINIRMSDYDAYYNSGYTREIYKSDYDYSSTQLNHPGSDLEVYVTYKITVRNQSQTIMTQIKELVDFYDKTYTYRDDMSWVTYSGDGKNNTVTDDQYYDMIVSENTSAIANARSTKASNTSKYGSATHSDVTNTYNAIYVRGLEDKKLATGESAYVYLTFQVKKENGKVITDNNGTVKSNLAEINGYTTYYANNTKLPNNVTKGSSDIAGLLDRDSNPGNLTAADISDNDRYEKNFEDDTDRAKSLRVIVENDDVRKINGTVWEDERTQKVGDAIIGDGVRDNDEVKVEGVNVELIEKTIDGKEYIWQTTTTNNEGVYNFEGYIPGDYIVRFKYGNTTDTVKIESDGGKNDVSYNGQDFKSTTYQAGMTQNEVTNDYSRSTKKYPGYRDTQTQNETGTYGYDIYEADAYGKNVSDVKDIWSRREVVNKYSDTDVTNHKAEILASPYVTPTYNGKEYTNEQRNSLINELITNTNMTAESGVIAVEFEYDRQQTEGPNNESNGSDKYLNGNDLNGNYTINNLDLGLTERPKAQLEIDKSITNAKVTLANGSVLFDVSGTANNVIWKDHTEYNVGSKKQNGKFEEYYNKKGKHRYSYRDEINNIVDKADGGLIQLTMDEELMHGATIQLTYRIKVTNVGEVDYEGQDFYYVGREGGNTVTTTANQVVDYVANNLQFNSNNEANQGWSIIKAEELTGENNLVNSNLANNTKQFNNIIQTGELDKALTPGETTEKTLILTQLITTENTDDDLTYSNITEIVKTSNTVGRRMAYSIVGNQDPTAEQATEIDSSVAERVIILPPFGNARIIYYALGIGIAIVLIGGIILIRKLVLKRKDNK